MENHITLIIFSFKSGLFSLLSFLKKACVPFNLLKKTDRFMHATDGHPNVALFNFPQSKTAHGRQANV
jgi:hypothetical protein